MKLKNSQLLILKIKTSHIKKNKKNIKLTFEQARENDEIISLGSSQFSRSLEKHCLDDGTKDEVYNIGGQSVEDIFLENDWHKYQITNAIISVEVQSKNYYDVLNKESKREGGKKGFLVNDVRYVEYIGTTGGVKNSTVFYIRADLYDWATKRLDNGRNMLEKFIPSKLQAYKALDMSVSNPMPQPESFIVVKDCEVEFTDSVIELDIDENKNPIENQIDDYNIKLSTNDGFGLISPRFAKVWAEDLGLNYVPSCFIVRNSFCKGALMVFDYVEFSSQKNNKDYMVTDVWGDRRSVYGADFILTESMLKLWKSYENMESYIEQCKLNDHQFCITKLQKEKNDESRMLNYQFIQPLDLSDGDIKELCDPTLNLIESIVNSGWEEKILYLRGLNMNFDNVNNYENDFIKALMVDKDMMYDPYVKSRINNMIQKMMNEAKFGKLSVRGNFSILSGDAYALCQSMFNQKVTGLLKAGELYMSHWNEKCVKEVVALRAPMSSINNEIKMKLNDSENCRYWFQHMSGCSVINTWDTTTHTLNGADMDGDLLFTTDNEVFLRNVPDSKSIVCVQSSGKKKLVEQWDFHESNKKGFSNKIGSITNKGATMSDLKSLFDKDSKEYKELDARIRYIQLYQQMEIDSLKGIEISEMPKYWYSKNDINKHANYEEYEDKYGKKRKRYNYTDEELFNLSILANNKPYFMIYIYDHLMKEYREYIEKQETICANRFLKPLNDMLEGKYELSVEELEFINKYYEYFPVSNNNGTMNRICKYVEERLDGIKLDNKKMSGLNVSKLKSNNEYPPELFSDMKRLYQQYNKKVQNKTKELKSESSVSHKERKKEKFSYINGLNDEFRKRGLDICGNMETMCDVLIDVCYTSNTSKNFVWDLCGKQIIENLLNNNGRTISYLEKDICGGIEYLGERFKLCEKEV